MNTMQRMPDDATVRDALREVEDPEAGMDIVELGLIYAVEVEPGRVTVDMTMTSPACPVADMLVNQATAVVQRLCPPDAEVEVRLVWEPPWDASMMSGIAKEFFGWNPR